MKSDIYKKIQSNKGFTLIEILVVVSIIGLVLILAVSNIGPSGKNYLNITKGFIAKTFDDAYIHNRINFLVIHLSSPGDEDSDNDMEATSNNVFSQRNGLSVVQMKGKAFVPHKRRLFRFRGFPDSFRIERVVMPDNQVIESGFVMVPFYPKGFSKDIIIHVLVNDENRYSIKIDKHIKEPLHAEEYIKFEGQE